MTETDFKTLPSTSLSAEAKSFIPSHLKEAQSGGTVPTHDGQNITQGLPKYMTNCYPFVQNDVQHRSSISGNHRGRGWQQPRTGFNTNVHRKSFPTGMYNGHQASPRMPGMQHFNQRLPRPQAHAGTVHPTQHPPPMIPTVHMQGPPPNMPSPQQQHSPIPPNYISPTYQVSPGPMTPPSWMSPPPHMSYVQDKNYYGQGILGHVPSREVHGFAPHGHMKKRGDWNNMVSVGIQNEATLYNPAIASAALSGSSKKRNKPKTIMCMDAAIQTDFADELANKTLLEKPSSLYQHDRSRNYLRLYQDSTTDSEVDSDSGYSSPMHRRNQASSGTHPLTATLGYLPPPPVAGPYPPLSAMGVPPPPVFSGYAQAVAGFTSVPNLRRPPPPINAYANGISTHKQSHTVGATRHNNIDKSKNTFPKSSIQQQQTLNTSRTASPVKQGYSSVVSTNVAKHNNPTPNHSSFPKQTAANDSQYNIVTEKYNTATDKSYSPSRAKTEGEEEEDALSTGSKPKRKRNRRKKKQSEGSPERPGPFGDGSYDLTRAQSSSNVSRTSTVENEILHFEDENEFPNLLSAVGGLQSDNSQQNMTSVSYCDILKGQVVSHLSQDSAQSYSSGGGFKSSPESVSSKVSKEAKNARKKRKRREAIDKAADAELAEITLEQQVLRELSAQSQSEQQKKGGKRSSQPMSLNIADMISALEKQHVDQRDQASANSTAQGSKLHLRKDAQKVANMLDSSAPVKRGKEREVAKPKKPSPLKKVILKEREEKKRLRLLEDGVTVEVTTEMDDVNDEDGSSQENLPEDEENLSPDVGLKSTLEINADASAELSPISQTSPITMSPLSGSPLNSGFNSPIANQNALGSSSNSPVLSRIHSRRFREYCNQVLDKDIDNCCMLLLQELVRFQDRLYHKDPNKAKSKRRIVLGLREVTKHLKMKKIKCVIISPNLERIQSKGGLDEALNNIIVIAQDQTVPVVFALGRRALGRACAKLVPVSVVGIFNYEGCDEYFKNLMDMTKKARDAYLEMVQSMEKEVLEANRNNQSHTNVISTIADVPKFFSHMGHSRTPSGCSGISLTSSILSEPISENYPYSEPETDSRGYEIVRSKYNPSKVRTEGSGETLEEKLQKIESDLKDLEEQERTQSPRSSTGEGKICIVESLCEIDEGNEADTEDDVIKRFKDGVKREMGDNKDIGRTDEEIASKSKLPPFDSIHASITDSLTDGSADNQITPCELSKECNRITKNDSVEAMSTHSSKTLEAGRCTPDRLSRNMGSVSDLPEASTASGSSARKVKAMDNERIEEWVAKTQKQVEMLNLEEGEQMQDQNSDKCAVNDEEYGDDISERLSNDTTSVGDNEDSINECAEDTPDVAPSEQNTTLVT